MRRLHQDRLNDYEHKKRQYDRWVTEDRAEELRILHKDVSLLTEDEASYRVRSGFLSALQILPSDIACSHRVQSALERYNYWMGLVRSTEELAQRIRLRPAESRPEEVQIFVCLFVCGSLVLRRRS